MTKSETFSKASRQMAFYAARAEADDIAARLQAQYDKPLEILFAEPIREDGHPFLPTKPYMIAVYEPLMHTPIDQLRQYRRAPEKYHIHVQNLLDLPKTHTLVYPVTMRLIEEDSSTRIVYHWAQNGYVYRGKAFEPIRDEPDKGDVLWFPTQASSHQQ